MSRLSHDDQPWGGRRVSGGYGDMGREAREAREARVEASEGDMRDMGEEECEEWPMVAAEA